ncbi:uncharacterized protein V1513DRAFT_410014 [Lipomyces chichibuensis]|uniref:uncharacterized protein n=1 Tax=Lipomyces chichibuensis TaxID=1546026 RepID=UPI00334376AD
MISWLAERMRRSYSSESTSTTTERCPAQNLARTSGSRAARADSNSMPAMALNGHRKRGVSEDDQDEITAAGLQTPQRRKRRRSLSKTLSITESGRKPTILQSETASTAPVAILRESNAVSTTSIRSASSSPTPASRPLAKRARIKYTRHQGSPKIRSHSLVPTSRSRKRRVANDEDEIDDLDRGRKDVVWTKLESARDSDAVEGEDTARRVISDQLGIGSVTRSGGGSAVRLPTETAEDHMQAGIGDDKRGMPEIPDAEVGSSDPEEQDQVEDDYKYIAGRNHEVGKVSIENGAQVIASRSSLELPAVVAEPQQLATAQIPVPESTMSLTSPIVEKSIKTNTSSTSIGDTSMDKIKRRVLAQLNGKLPIPIIGLDDAHKKIYDLFEQTILAPMLDVALASSKSESPSSLLSSTKFHGGNSALLLGPRASGKSLIISTALAELERKYKGQFIVVRLSGFAQTDDKQALQEIAAQIEYGIEALDEDDYFYDDLDDGVKESPTKIRYKRQNSSIALERLLSLFSGRAGVRDDNEEPLGEQQSQQQQPVVSVLIILEEFERFATMQNRQTLLYNLLDVAQSPRYSLKSDTPAPNICIIGVSSRMTAPEMLEKRVRSRFSHRVIVLPHMRDVESFWRVCSSGLKVTSAPTVAMMAAMVNASNYSRGPTRLKKSEYTIERRATEVWNSYIDSMYSTSPEVRRIVDLAFATSRDSRQVHMQFLSAVRKAGQMIPFMATSEIGGRGVDVLENAGIMEKVAGLSELSLMLLICAARAEIKYATTTSVPVGTLSPTKSGAISNTAERRETAVEFPPMVPNKSLLHSSQHVITKVTPISFTLAYEEYLSQAGKTRLAEASAGAIITMPFRVWSREQAVAAWEALERGGLVVNASEIAGSVSTGRVGSAISEMQAPEIGLMELGEIVKDMRGVNSVARQWCSAL